MTTLDIPEPVASFIERVNAHDDNIFLETFAADGVVDDWGRSFVGHAAINEWNSKEFTGSQGTLAVDTVAVDGNVVTVVGDWRSNHANGRSTFIFETAGDLLTKMTIRGA